MIDSDSKEKLKSEALKVLELNRRRTDGHQYTVPSPVTYPYQWFWDSCFHAIVLSHLSLEDAKKEITSLLAHQHGNGMIPHITYWEKKSILGKIPVDIQWGTGDTSSITQPPLIAEAVWKIYEKEKNTDFLEEVYPALYHYYKYLLTERDPRENNLAGIINPDESGEDNSPRFDSLLGLSLSHSQDENQKKRIELVEKLKTCDFDAPFCMKNFFWVEDVPFNSFLVKNLNLLSEIAEVLNNKEDALYFSEESLKVSKAMREKMKEGFLFWSTKGEEHQRIKIKTWAIFSPMFASILSSEEAEELVERYLLSSDEFMSEFMVPSVSKSELSYNPKEFWRGPTWIAVNWFVFHGLMNYRMRGEAEKVLESTVRLLEKSGFREYFNPETGEGYGAKDFTWGALIVDMFERNDRED